MVPLGSYCFAAFNQAAMFLNQSTHRPLEFCKECQTYFYKHRTSPYVADLQETLYSAVA